MVSRVVCIIGAFGGIGLEIVNQFSKEKDINLILMDISLSQNINIKNNKNISFFEIDLENFQSIQLAFNEAKKIYRKIDSLILVSGIVENNNISNMTVEFWDKIINVNLRGFFLSIKEAENWINDGGRLVTLGSMSGHQGSTITGPAYASSKAGIEGLTKHLAVYLADREITVNCITPGPVDTPMLEAHDPKVLEEAKKKIPLKRFASPKEIAALVFFLCSKDASYITGSILSINGGIRTE